MTIDLSPHQTRLLRLRAQNLLAPPSVSPTEVAGAVCGIQAQDLAAAQLSIRARCTGLTVADVARDRLEERSLAWTWCQRGTLHLIPAQDARWLVPLLGPALIADDRRRMAQLGWDDRSAAQGVRLVQEAVEKDGPLVRAEIADRLRAAGLPYEGQATPHLLYKAALECVVCSGSDQDGDRTYTLFDDWLGSPQPLQREEGLARLAQRYLRAYAPATREDFAAWAGLKVKESRDAWEGIRDQRIEVTANGEQPAWILETQLPWLDEPLSSEPVVRLLPRFDTLWMGYANRDLLIEPESVKRVNAGGGMIRPFLLVDGRILGIWKTTRKKVVTELVIDPFEPLDEEILTLIEAEVADIGRFVEEETQLVRTNPI